MLGNPGSLAANRTAVVLTKCVEGVGHVYSSRWASCPPYRRLSGASAPKPYTDLLTAAEDRDGVAVGDSHYLRREPLRLGRACLILRCQDERS